MSSVSTSSEASLASALLPVQRLLKDDKGDVGEGRPGYRVQALSGLEVGHLFGKPPSLPLCAKPTVSDGVHGCAPIQVRGEAAGVVLGKNWPCREEGADELPEDGVKFFPQSFTSYSLAREAQRQVRIHSPATLAGRS